MNSRMQEIIGISTDYRQSNQASRGRHRQRETLPLRSAAPEFTRCSKSYFSTGLARESSFQLVVFHNPHRHG